MKARQLVVFEDAKKQKVKAPEAFENTNDQDFLRVDEGKAPAPGGAGGRGGFLRCPGEGG